MAQAYGGRMNRFPPIPSQERLDAEFSEIGRSPRFPPGWYIAPLFILGVAMGIWLCALTVNLLMWIF